MPKDQSARLPISKRKTVFDGKIWNVIRETFDYKGQTLVREFVDHPGAVAVVAVNENREILLLKQYRHPVREYLWELPAGLLDAPGEYPQQAAERELLEETGYRADNWREIKQFYTTPGGNSELITIFLATNLRKVESDFKPEGEEVDLEIEWVPLAEAVRSVMRNEIKSPTAVVGILTYAIGAGPKKN